MAGYMNSYNMGYGMGNSYGQPTMMQPQSYGQAPGGGAPLASNILGYQVDGEVGAKSFSMPNGATGPIALWDMNDGVFYLRTFNSAGFPQPLERYRFVKEEITPNLPAGQSGGIDPSQVVSRNEFDQLNRKIDELTAAMNGMRNRGNSGNGGQGRQQG